MNRDLPSVKENFRFENISLAKYYEKNPHHHKRTTTQLTPGGK